MDDALETKTHDGDGGQNVPLPIKPPLEVLKYHTIDKKFGWWAAVVLLQSYAKKQVCFYLWQLKGSEWKRKQKFGIHSVDEWKRITKAVDEYLVDLEQK
jgi:hypothetical protein